MQIVQDNGVSLWHFNWIVHKQLSASLSLNTERTLTNDQKICHAQGGGEDCFARRCCRTVRFGQSIPETLMLANVLPQLHANPKLET